MPKPIEFNDLGELRRHLANHRLSIEGYFKRPDPNLAALVRESVGQNTFRALRNLPLKPSAVFREWAYDKVSGREFWTKLEAIQSHEQFDAWLLGLVRGLGHHWRRKMGSEMPFTANRKLPDLLLKALVRWSGIENRARTRLIGFLHIPLDMYSLAAFRRCLPESCPVSRGASMGFVDCEEKYCSLQFAIRRLAVELQCPPIYLDVLAWDVGHQ